ncbi:hypothetical protein K461DRAFT_59947 [Myriangium duriaei CBS 260.36]|uniref:ADF-H domain-containing protein n=1 Tax=Myriangium duriaei CBS 260.36 TaxID=1168546 RepID=A0A9P4IRC3_9PEZI|nr:hypothetical protein K461DRAFT_59947 [Myriangium duriaei CBS 260.36]
MSLNGLDDSEVTQAFTSAVAESAGWFLLKYTSRDTVELLGKGAGGVSDARTCLSSYLEASPLYGLIMFRRKRVLIKYIPEGTSRLLQARTTVHFQGVVEKFSPHDALLDISNAEGLSDTALAATFPLHAGSTVANNLDEIAEDGEETTPLARERQPSVSSTTSKLSRKAALERVAALKRTAALAQMPLPSSAAGTVSTAANQAREVHPDEPVSEQALKQPLDTVSIADHTLNHTHTTKPGLVEVDHTLASPATGPPEMAEKGSGSYVGSSNESAALQLGASEPYRPQSPSVEQSHPTFSLEVPRASSDTSYSYLDSASLHDLGIYEFKPKVKLAPRQVQIKEIRRASHMPASVKRHVSTTPSAPQLRSHKPELEDRPSKVDEPPSHATLPKDSPMIYDSQFPQPLTQNSQDGPEMQAPTRPQSSASFRSASIRNSQHKVPLTPEKQRLMKAMEMRKRQHRRSQQPHGLRDVVEGLVHPTEDRTPAIPEVAESNSDAGVAEPVSELTYPDSNDAELKSEKQQQGKAQKATRSDSPHESLMELTGNSIDTTREPGPVHFPKQVLTALSLLEVPQTITCEDDQVEDDATKTPTAEHSSCAIETEAMQEVMRPASEQVANLDTTPPAMNADSMSHMSLVDDEVGRDLSLTTGATDLAIDYEDITPPAESTTDATPRRRTTSQLDQYPGHTTFFRESVSTQGLPPSREGFLDTASEFSEPGRTWLSDGSGTRTRSSSINSHHALEETQRRKRRGVIAPIITPVVTPTPSSVPHTDAASIDDDDFEYFGNATVHEATSMAVLRTPVLSSKPSLIQMSSSPPSQSVSSDIGMSPVQKRIASPMHRVMNSQELSTYESDSRSSLIRAHSSHSASSSAAPEDLVAATRKTQIGSGISQRIAKLAQSRSKETSPLTSPSSLPQLPGSTTRKSSQRLFESNADVPQRGRVDGNHAALMKGRLRPIDTLPTTRLPPGSQTGSPSKRQSHAYYTIHKDPDTRRESVQVTARIVRPNARQEDSEVPVLQQPELSIKSRSPVRRTREPSAVPTVRRDQSVGSTLSRKSLESSKLKRFSFARGRSHDSRPESSASGKFSLRPPSPVTEPVPPLPSSPPKGNRTSRFLKRMSGLSAVTRKRSVKPGPPINTPALLEIQHLDLPNDHGFEPSLSEAMLDPSTRSSVRIGDVNVQFPHTGLWKRRCVEIDAAGKLVFSTNDMSSFPARHREPAGLYSSSILKAGGVRAFDLKNITAVYVPRPDDMELANSVVLSLGRDEGTITVACEDGTGQAALLNCEYILTR